MEQLKASKANAPSRSVLLIAPEGGFSFGLAGLAEIFNRANRELPAGSHPQPYTWQIAATEPELVVAGSAGIRIVADVCLANLDPRLQRDTIIVTGGGDRAKRHPKHPAVEWLRAAAPHARRVVSVCTGAYFLAATGLLDGRKASTHWGYAPELQELFPRIKIEPDRIFVQDGKYFTSAGASAGLDLGLALVESDLGQPVALAVARMMVLHLCRSGGQSQFSAALRRQSSQPGPIREVQAYALEHLTEDLRVEKLADAAAMSPRNFARVFQRETGITPAQYIEELRVEAAQTRLENSAHTIEAIARDCGFGTATSLRRSFDRQLRISPAEYRARFQSSARP